MDQWPGEEKELACLRLILSYVTDTVKASFKREITELAVIPGGLTSLLQPLDVSLNKPFEDEVRKQWMADGIHEFTATERQKKASEEPICSWISQAWKAIPSEMIAASFLKCGITNNSDGSKYNFGLQSRSLMNLMIQSSKTYLNRTASWNLKVSLFKDTEHFT